MTEVFKGSTSHSILIELVDEATGLPATGIAYTAVTASYARTRSARVAITTADAGSVTAGFSAGRWYQIDSTNQPGVYRLDVTDAAFATGAEEVVVTVKATGCRTVSRLFVLVDWNKQVAAIPNAAANASGGLITDIPTPASQFRPLQLISTVWDGPDTSSVAAGTAIPGYPWVDSAGSVYRVTDGNLVATITSGNYATDRLVLPTHAVQDQRLVYRFVVGAKSANALLRIQSATTFYLMSCSAGSQTLYAQEAGSLRSIAENIGGVTLASGHTVEVDIAAEGINSTTFTLTIRDLTSNTTLIDAYTVTDSGALLQASGGIALSVGGGSGSVTFVSAAYYDLSAPVLAEPILLLQIGDSITHDVPSGGVAPGDTTADIASKAGEVRRVCIPLNRGIPSTTTADWLPGGTNFDNALAAALTYPAGFKRVAFVCLGVNDAKTSIATSQATYQSRIEQIAAALVAAGFKVIANGPTYAPPTGAYDASAADRLSVQYPAAIEAAADERTIFAGDFEGYFYFRDNPGETIDTIHPTATGAAYLGGLWYDAMAAALGLPKAVVTAIRTGLATESALAVAKAAIDAVHAKTTNLPANPAATGDQMDLVPSPNADALTEIGNRTTGLMGEEGFNADLANKINGRLPVSGTLLTAEEYTPPDNSGITAAASAATTAATNASTAATQATSAATDAAAAKTAAEEALAAVEGIPAAPDLRGPGADSVTMNIKSDGDNVADADVWITADEAGSNTVAGTLQTNAGGNVTFLLDAGETYYLWMQKDGENPIVAQEFVAEAD